ncbi:glycosyltransferase involved in cell wall biosynthesis [Deinococcus metalli]|uniref:Glycosyl transferase n=1 Tax=Deinococcus metalli TaxID=1141878 RepID=A0A7W8KC12_9DEIO|nr:glycosyltransferase [Deinococcus metalli]MBB5375165.1 glycosyltransferase involved in cell wall biosynthesis [Deinococcus metalli]GHF31238.1 glycosyl transferase [Deinococcus metalli]
MQGSSAARIAVVIPAFNEEGTVADVVRVARQFTPEVVVASDGSSDATAAVARAAGATVVELTENAGKGHALGAALAATDADYIVMLDADLTGLTPAHLGTLVRPVLDGTLDMSIGVFEGGGFVTDWGNKLTPHLSGQRACRREWLVGVPHLTDERWPEPAITAHLKETGARWDYVELPNVAQVVKEKKRGFWKGAGARTRMYAQLLTYRARRK